MVHPGALAGFVAYAAALFALAIQFGVSFGHFHEAAAQAVQTARTVRVLVVRTKRRNPFVWCLANH